MLRKNLIRWSFIKHKFVLFLGSQVLSVQQSLIVVFAHLIQNNLNDVVNFLVSTPGPQGGSAFDFVMYEWVTKQHFFSGPYDIKVR